MSRVGVKAHLLEKMKQVWEMRRRGARLHPFLSLLARYVPPCPEEGVPGWDNERLFLLPNGYDEHFCVQPIINSIN